MPEKNPLNDDERDELIAYLDGELTEADARRVESKLSADPAIRAEADSLKRTWDLLDYLPRPEPSPSFTHRTFERLTPVRPLLLAGPFHRRRWLLGLGWAAALLVATLAGYAAAPLVLPGWKAPGDPSADADQQLARELRLVERLRLYQHVNDIQFLNELDRPELFGDDQAGF